MIYILEDDAAVRDLVVYALTQTGLEAAGFATPADFYPAVHGRVPDLILLDYWLPGETGLDVLRRLRSHAPTQDVPVIMLTALGAEADKVRCLDQGADDYVTKPFGMMELLARVRAGLRRRRPPPPVITVGPLRWDRARHAIGVADRPLTLTRKEYALLGYLMLHPDTVFSQEQLLTLIWERDAAVETRTVEVHIRSLRHKLGPAAAHIDTVRGFGYRLLTAAPAVTPSPGGDQPS